MSEQSTQNNQQTKQNSDKSSQATNVDQLINELDRLGNQLIDAIRTAWNSDQRKELESEISKGIASAASSLNEGLQKVSESESTKQIINKAEEVFSTVGEQVRSSKVTHDLVAGLSQGIQALNSQLEQFVSSAKQEAKKTSEESQEIKVEKEG